VSFVRTFAGAARTAWEISKTNISVFPELNEMHFGNVLFLSLLFGFRRFIIFPDVSSFVAMHA
jgi:hypothetical protein